MDYETLVNYAIKEDLPAFNGEILGTCDGNAEMFEAVIGEIISDGR
jgi:hypothetical protein